MPKLYMKTFFIVISLTAFILCAAEAEEVLTWQECIGMALNRHPDLMVAAEKVNEAKEDKNIEISSMLPQIEADLSGSRSQSSVKSTEGEQYTKKYNNVFQYSLRAQQLLFDGFKTSSDISSALRMLQAEGYNYLVISSDIRLDLRNAFVSLLRAQRLVPLTEEIRARRKQNFKLVQLRYKAGREHRGALLTAEADLANAQFEVEQAMRNITLTQRELLKELGTSKFRYLKLESKFELLDGYNNKPDLDEVAETNPFLKQLIAKKESASFNLNSEEADFFPKIYLDGSIGRTNDDWPPKQDEWAVGFSVAVPVFEGGKRISEVTRAKAKVRQTKAEEQSGRDSIVVTLEGAWKDLQDSITEVAVKKQFRVAGEERAKIARAQYASGLISFDDWIIIENNLVVAEKAYLNSQANMLISEAYWIQAKGGTLEYENEK